MAFYKEFRIVSIFSLQSLIIFCRMIIAFKLCQRASENFIIEPADITTYQGNSVNFTCSTRDLDWILEWRIDPENEQTRHHLFRDERNGITTTILTIEATGRMDYFITCNINHVHFGSDQGNEMCFATRRATLTIHYFPKRSDLQCSPNKSTELKIGDILSLECRVTRSKPAVDLRWDMGNLLLPMVKDYGRIRYLSSKFLINKEMHLKIVTCIVTSKIVFPGRTLNCSIGPLEVLQPPHVTLYGMNKSLTPDHSVGVFCEALGYPSVYEFSWTCQPDHIINGCDTRTHNVSLSLACQNAGPEDPCAEIAHATISCTAFNTAGNGTGSINITIEGAPEISSVDFSDPHTECENEELLNITAHVHRKNKNSPIEVTVFCMIVHQNINTQIRWFFEGASVHLASDRFIVKKLWKSLYSLQIINPSREDNGKEVSCKATTCNSTNTASLILSFDINENLGIPSSEYPPSTAPQSNPLSLWQMVTIAGAGVILTIILTAFMVTMIFMCLYRRSGIDGKHRKGADNDHGGQGEDDSSLSSNVHSLNVSTYEIPDVATATNTSTLTDSHEFVTIPHYHEYGLEHKYEPGRERESGLSSSSQSSWTSCSDTCYIESGYEMSSYRFHRNIPSKVSE